MPSAIRLLERFCEHYPHGINPYLDHVYNDAMDLFERNGALKGLVGLFEMIINRDDISPAVREAIEKNYRYITARKVIEDEGEYIAALEQTLDVLIGVCGDVDDHLVFNRAVPRSMQDRLHAQVEIAKALRKRKELMHGNEEQAG